MKSQLFRKTVLASAVTAASFSPLTSFSEEESTRLLEEIIVTATARQTTVQEIPYNISAISGDDLAAQQITGEADLLRSISGVSLVDRGERNAATVNSIVIRGLNVDAGTAGDNPQNAVATVSTYLDNTPMYGRFVLKDIQRVEVLRGPQGTLYGSGALGGTLRTITNKPNPNELEGKIEVNGSQSEGSDGYNMDIYGMINVPINETTAIRAHAGRINNDGVIDYVNAYQTNEFQEPLIDDGNGNCIDPRNRGLATDDMIINNNACFHNDKDADTVDIDYARIAIRSDITNDFSVTLAYQTQEDKIGGRRAFVQEKNNGQPVGSPLRFDYDEKELGLVVSEPSSREADLYSLDVEWDMGFATLTSNSSYFEHEAIGQRDNGGLWHTLQSNGTNDNFHLYYPGWARPAQRTLAGFEEETSIQEFRLVSNAEDSTFDWLVGAFYIDQDRSVFSDSINAGMNNWFQACSRQADPYGTCVPNGVGWWQLAVFPGQTLTENDFELRRDEVYEELAIYSEVTWNISEDFRVTGGARWYDNDNSIEGVFGFPLVAGFLDSPRVEKFENSDSDVLLKLNASYDLDEGTMIYGTVSEGYRRGGVNAVNNPGETFGEPEADKIKVYDADSVINYELGIKGQTDEMEYTVSLFYVDWKDPQLNTGSAVFGFPVVLNGGSAHTMGIEAEVNGYLTHTLHYRLGYTYVEAELDEDLVEPQFNRVTAPDGATLPGSPEHVVSFALDNTWTLSDDVDLVAQVNGYYQSETENHISVSGPAGDQHDGFFLLGGSATLLMDNWHVTFYAKNLTDEEGVTGSFPSTTRSYDTGTFDGWYGNGNLAYMTQSRTLGFNIGYSF